MEAAQLHDVVPGNENREHYITQYFSRNHDKWMPLEITTLGKIGEGNFMSIFEVEAEIEGRKKRRFVIKRPLPEFFKEPQWDDLGGYMRNGEEEAIGVCTNEIQGWRFAKENGLKVFPTCRYLYGEKGPEVLETLGFGEEWICIGDKGDSSKVETYGREKLKRISGFEEFIKIYFRQASLGYLKGMHIGADAYLFFVNRREDKLDFVIGDTNFLENEREFAGTKYILSFNLSQAELALKNFLDKNIDASSVSDHLESAGRHVEEIMKQDKLKVTLRDYSRKLKNIF